MMPEQHTGDEECGKWQTVTDIYFDARVPSFQRRLSRRSWKIWIFSAASWLLALHIFINTNVGDHAWRLAKWSGISKATTNAHAITLDSVLNGEWRPQAMQVSWVQTPDGQDGMILEKDVRGKDYLVVEDVRSAGFAGKHTAGCMSEESSVRQDDQYSKVPSHQYVPSQWDRNSRIIQVRFAVWNALGGIERVVRAGALLARNSHFDRTNSCRKMISHSSSRTLMKKGYFKYEGQTINPSRIYPSPDLTKVLVMSDWEKNWRHSGTGRFWIFDVQSQTAEPLDPSDPDGRIQLATWSPTSDSVVFTRSNNMFIRSLKDNSVKQITHDGGANLFYGIPDWVYEEEVFAGPVATWWSLEGGYIAFFRSENAGVPEFPVQYFVSRPSGETPVPGSEAYPETRKIKYPKAGAPNPLVEILFYDVKLDRVLDTRVQSNYPAANRLITEVVWVGDSEILVRETDRTSDSFELTLGNLQTENRTTVRSVDVKAIDGGWYDPGEYIKFVPKDPDNGRENDGYIDTIIYKKYNHLAYFTPIDNPNPIVLTKGEWEVVGGASSVDLKNNLIYFVATKAGPTQRQVYSVKIDGTDIKPFTNDTKDGYHGVSFSTGSGYALLTNLGPDVPSQQIVSTPSLNNASLSLLIEPNTDLAKKVSKAHLPTRHYSTVTIDGFELQLAEYRPVNFNSSHRYPVIFYLYQGPGSQQVDKRFSVNFQTYLASLGYIVLTLDGRGTGFVGRNTRSIIRDNLGYYESHDQIHVAKLWSQKSYVDPERLAVWGWSYGGFMTLKILETDAGRTFKYGMAVAPVTDWRYYDSVYTERYMHTPQTNPYGYNFSAINNATALGQNVRFLLMHGTGDDNVHFQNSLVLLDKLDVAGVENYDFHAFPDSDHGISFHNANSMVYGRLSSWLVNAFNGEWVRLEKPMPKKEWRKRELVQV